MIYVPSAWWHEVITDDNQEGLSAGINYFFDPYFVRRRDFGHVYLHESRKYSHIRSGPAQTARPCTNNYVCFRKIKSSMRRKRFQIRSGG